MAPLLGVGDTLSRGIAGGGMGITLPIPEGMSSPDGPPLVLGLDYVIFSSYSHIVGRFLPIFTDFY